MSIKAEPDEDIPVLNSSTPCDDDDEDHVSDCDYSDHSFIPPREGMAMPKSATSQRRRSKRTPKRVERYRSVLYSIPSTLFVVLNVQSVLFCLCLDAIDLKLSQLV